MPYSSDPLPPEFFANPRYPPTPVATEVMTVEVNQSEVSKELEKSGSAGNQSLFLPFFFLSSPFL